MDLSMAERMRLAGIYGWFVWMVSCGAAAAAQGVMRIDRYPHLRSRPTSSGIPRGGERIVTRMLPFFSGVFYESRRNDKRETASHRLPALD